MRKIYKVLFEILAILIGLLYLSPFYIMIVNSFKNRAEMYNSVLALPEKIHFEYFATAMKKMSFLRAITNSLIITSITILLIVIFSSMTGWMLVRTNNIYSKIIFFSLVVTMIIPFQALMMPLMHIMGIVSRNTPFHILNTRFGLIYTYLGFGCSMGTFLYHGFTKGISISLEEAATLDGCNKWQTFWKIIFPILQPTTVAVIILDVIWIWNDFLLPSLLLSDKPLRTIPLSTFYFFGEFTIQWNLAMAGLVLTIIPVILFYIFAQKYIVEGITAGAVK